MAAAPESRREASGMYFQWPVTCATRTMPTGSWSASSMVTTPARDALHSTNWSPGYRLADLEAKTRSSRRAWVPAWTWVASVNWVTWIIKLMFSFDEVLIKQRIIWELFTNYLQTFCATHDCNTGTSARIVLIIYKKLAFKVTPNALFGTRHARKKRNKKPWPLYLS